MRLQRKIKELDRVGVDAAHTFTEISMGDARKPRSWIYQVDALFKFCVRLLRFVNSICSDCRLLAWPTGEQDDFSPAEKDRPVRAEHYYIYQLGLTQSHVQEIPRH
jgi:hypothetical protein